MFEQNRCMWSGIWIAVSRASFWRLRGRFLTPGGRVPPMLKWIWNKCFNTFKMSRVWAKLVHVKWYFIRCLQRVILETLMTVHDSWRSGASDVKVDLKQVLQYLWNEPCLSKIGAWAKKLAFSMVQFLSSTYTTETRSAVYWVPASCLWNSWQSSTSLIGKSKLLGNK